MGVVQDIIDGIGEIAESLIKDALAELLKVVISGFTLVFSSPAIALATMFNSEVGWVDPLLLVPIPLEPSGLTLFHFHGTIECRKKDMYIHDEHMNAGLYCSYRNLYWSEFGSGLTCNPLGLYL